jgi:hypothetical protein
MGKPYGCAQVNGFEPSEISSDKARRFLGYNPSKAVKIMIDRALRSYSP